MRVLVIGISLLYAPLSLGCTAGPLPEPFVPGTLIREVRLQNCDVPVLNIRERYAGRIDDMWKYISMSDLCKLAVALKRNMDAVSTASENLKPGDWTRIKSVDVYRMAYPAGPAAPQPEEVRIHLYADIPDRPRLVGVSMSKTTGVVQFFIVHR